MTASRRKGTAWESAIVATLREQGWPHAERRSLNGAKDRGDVAGIPGVVIEAKNARAMPLALWLDETHREAVNDGASVGVCWIKRRGHLDPLDGYVLMDGRTLLGLLKDAGYRR